MSLIFRRGLTLFIFINLISSSQKLFSQIVRNVPDTVKVYKYSFKGRTKSGLITTEIKQPFLAVSRDLLQNYPLHSNVILYDCKWSGTYKVLDIMGRKHTKTVDIFYRGKKKTNKQKCLCTLALE